MTIYNQAKKIAREKGGYREQAVLKQPHSITRGDTWNDEHKVLNVIAKYPDKYGTRAGFAVDIVTGKICG